MSVVVRRIMLWIPPLLYALMIFHLSSEANPLPQLTAVVWDKALHTTEYAGLAWLLARAVRGEDCSWRVVLLAAVVLCSLYGASDEWHQSFVPGRDTEVTDWIADSLGGLVGSLAYVGLIRAYNKRAHLTAETPQ